MSPRDPAAFASKLQRLVFSLVKNYELCDRMCLEQHRVTASQGYALLSLPEDDCITMNQLSDIMGLANSTMTRVVDHLVEKDLAYRASDDEDRRVVRVGLTAKGRDLQRSLKQAQEGSLQQALSDIGDTEGQTMLRVLEKLNDSIRKVARACCGGGPKDPT